MIMSMVGAMVSLLFFGTSKTFFGMFASRCIGGGFGANWTWIASITILGEITDPSDSALGYSALNIGWSVGELERPYERSLGSNVCSNVARSNDW
jgi:MFS family permease